MRERQKKKRRKVQAVRGPAANQCSMVGAGFLCPNEAAFLTAGGARLCASCRRHLMRSLETEMRDKRRKLMLLRTAKRFRRKRAKVTSVARQARA